MRKTDANYEAPLTDADVGRSRVVHKFLWIPRRFGSEWRWLERADMVEEVRLVDVGDFCVISKARWVETGFTESGNL